MSTHFTPLASLLGGGMIGAAAALLWLSLGRIAGISGILGGLSSGGLSSGGSERAWRLAFLAGLIGAPLGYVAFIGMPGTEIAAGPVTLVLAGLLVGFGTRLGSGCTSGHGVCGIARLSPRSIAATLVFMATAAITVFITRHLTGG
ncbi:YeeE/YedE family protein [Rhodovarius crocodyli]|uniref:YeeE/YedE family protein n=1 Tax=Rhodovarius crocodyli TaxID=1979269 RepID=A0A437M235_9PROT|nr:YeeE/YedE family protein [Rhodovarius crocodyli]RVT91748.1 YeeE/YedE family protein [Rhodovarius crocodyli]